MGATTGLSAQGDYATPATNKEKVQALIDLIANPDSATAGTGAVAGGTTGAKNTYLDEMSPAAAAALRVELVSLKAAIEDAA